MLKVRSGEVRDHAAALEVWREANAGVSHPGHGDSLAQWMCAETARLFIVVDDSDIVGMTLLLIGRSDDGAGEPVTGLGHITGVAVLPTRQRCGAGHLLLDAAVEACRTRGDTRITLWTDPRNDTAVKLFSDLGFAPSGRSGSDSGGAPMVHLERRVDAHQR